MRVCTKCGKEFDEDMKFCPYCGCKVENMEGENEYTEVPAVEQEEESVDDKADVEGEEEELSPEELAQALAAAKAAGESKRIQREVANNNGENDSSYGEEEDDMPKSKLPMIIAITVILGVLIIAGVVTAIYFATNKGTDYTKVVETYLQGYQDKDVNKIISTYPEFMQKAITENASPEDIWKELDSSFSKGLGEDWKATYSIGEVTEISSGDLNSIKTDLEQSYDASVTMTKGYWVAADMTLSGSDNATTMPLAFAVVQIDQKWCVVYQTTRSTAGNSSSGAGESTAAQ